MPDDSTASRIQDSWFDSDERVVPAPGGSAAEPNSSPKEAEAVAHVEEETATTVGAAASSPRPKASEPAGRSVREPQEKQPQQPPCSAAAQIPDQRAFRALWAQQCDAADGTRLFRSEKRVAQPSLVLFDERGVPGECIVIRKREYRIGRAHGDLLIPHDLLVSGKHACLRWRDDQLDLVDEGSRNGTYWRLRQGCSYELRDGDRFLCGRYVFQWAENNGIVRLASFTDLGGAVRDFPIERNTTLSIGRDPRCSIRIPKDNFLSPYHARILFDRKNQTFVLTDENSLNGVFIKLTGPMPLIEGDMFRLGEQLIGVLFPQPKLS